MCFGGKQPKAPTNPAPYSMDDSHKAVTQTVKAEPQASVAPPSKEATVTPMTTSGAGLQMRM
jgi:hypothetical protein